MKLLLMLILCNLLIIVQNISAQVGEVTFSVIDVYTHNSLEGANVILRRDNDTSSDMTDGSGIVIFRKEAGIYDVVVTKTGYRATTQSRIILRDTGHITKTLELASDVGTKKLLTKLNKAYNGYGEKSSGNDLSDLITAVEKIKEYLTEDEIENYNYIRDYYNNKK